MSVVFEGGNLMNFVLSQRIGIFSMMGVSAPRLSELARIFHSSIRRSKTHNTFVRVSFNPNRTVFLRLSSRKQSSQESLTTTKKKIFWCGLAQTIEI